MYLVNHTVNLIYINEGILLKKEFITENLREPLENRLNALICKDYKAFNFSPKRWEYWQRSRTKSLKRPG